MGTCKTACKAKIASSRMRRPRAKLIKFLKSQNTLEPNFHRNRSCFRKTTGTPLRGRNRHSKMWEKLTTGLSQNSVQMQAAGISWIINERFCVFNHANNWNLFSQDFKQLEIKQLEINVGISGSETLNCNLVFKDHRSTDTSMSEDLDKQQRLFISALQPTHKILKLFLDLKLLLSVK